MRPPLLASTLALALTAGVADGAAQDASEAQHQRVAGCYLIERVADAPWLLGIEPRIRLTMEPMPSEPGTSPQYLMRPVASEPTVAPLYTHLSWSLYANGQLISIVWSSEQNLIGLTFVPEPERPNVASIGSTTFFSHELMKESPPVDLSVTAIDC